ncbi:hypothetical protein MATL_G00036010 [Megalops atlanticus]|uniref:Uncharacterized protein n=1 Tax=Megalops atlanticus TaxID=7932 RepID=A0A9D3TGK5_MEGAT|nr:hypothetical protein MATL_G00036010 [Megalops atlanticus]
MESRSKNVTKSSEMTKWSGCESGALKHGISKVAPSVLVEGEGGPFCCPVTRNMRLLLEEFKGLYEERLGRLEFETRGGNHEEMLRVKVRILHSYVNDLSDQNQVLVQTVEDLEKEANAKVSFLELKLCSSDQIIQDLDYQKRCLEENAESLRSENLDMKVDVATLVGAIQRARRMQQLDVSGVTLRTVSLEQIAEPSVYDKHTPKPEDIMKAHVNDLRSQVKAKDRIIQNLQEEIKKSSLERTQSRNEPSDSRHTFKFLQSKIDSLQKLEFEKVSQITERDITIAKLQTELQVARQDGRDVRNELSNQREKVNELQEALQQLNDQMAARDSQSEALLVSSKDLEEKVAELTAELQKSREQSQKQQKELLSLKQKNDGLLAELQSQEQQILKVQKAQHQKEEAEEAVRLAAQIEQLQVQLLESRNLHTQATCQLGATKRELEGVRAELAEARRQRDASQVESEAKMATVKNELSEEYGNKLREQELKKRQINEELANLKEKHVSAKEEISKLEKIVEEQATELKDIRLQHTATMEENGRLRARLEAQTVSARTEQDVLTSEISNTEGAIHALRMQQLENEKKISLAGEKIYSLENLLQEEKERCFSAESEVQTQCQVIHLLEKELKQAQLAEKDAVLKINEREERIRQTQLELTSLKATQDSLKRTATMKEHFNNELSQECSDLRQTLGCLQIKLRNSEEKVNSLDLEVGLLKSKLQEKTEQSQQLQDQILKQQEALSRANETLKDTRKAAGNKIHKKESKLAVMQKELLEVKTKNSECQNELLRRENLLQKLKEESVQLTAQIKEQSQDINKLNSEREKLELELTVVMEKHRTAQQEVSNRDQVILQLKTDLKAREEQCRGAREELGLHESEVSRLNERVKSLQSDVREMWEKSREWEERLGREEEEKQHLQHQLHATQQQMKNQMKTSEQLNSDFNAMKHAHTVDMERWNQKTLLLQSQLDQACIDLQDSQSKVQEQRLKVRDLEDKLSHAEVLHQEALAKVQSGEELAKKQCAEMLLLKQQIENTQMELRESNAAAKNHETSSDIFKQKYQTAMEKVQQLEGQIQSLEEEAQYSSKQVLEAQEVVSSLKAEVLNLEARYEEKCKQMENSEEAIDQLTEELQATQDHHKCSSDRVLELEQLIGKLKEEVDMQRKEISDHENTFLQLQSDLTSYQFSHSYSNEEYESQQKHSDLLQKELTCVSQRLREKEAWNEECKRTIEQLKAETLRLAADLQKRALENQGLERTLQSLHLDVASAHQGHKVTLAQLQQEVAQLETDLTDARKACAQRDQAIRKRDDLLKKSEADLLQAREAIKGKAMELEHLECTVKDLRGDLQTAETDKSQKQQENLALRTEIKQLNQELHDIHKQYRETAQELAGREERVLLLESSLRAAREQLGERAAEAVRQEQSARATRVQLRSAAERARAAEEEVAQLKRVVEASRGDASVAKASLQKALRESASQQRERHRAEEEHDGAKEEALALARQLEQQEDVLRCLREELGQEHTRYEDQQRQFNKLKMYMASMETEVEHFRVKQTTSAHMLKDRESRVSRLEDEISEIQEKHRSLLEKFLEAQSLLKVSNLSLAATEKQREHDSVEARQYESTLTKQKDELQEATESLEACHRNLLTAEQTIAVLQLELSSVKDSRQEAEDKAARLKTEQCILREKLEAATTELETQRLAVEEARADNARLRQESELAVANVSHWIKEQKIASESLAEKIVEQSKLLTLVSAEKDRLQETKDALEVDLKKLRAVIDDNKKEIEHLRAIHSHSANQQALLNQLRGRLEVEENERESLVAQNLARMEDMQSRLKANMESICLLNEQLNTLSAENANQRKLLEKERALRKQLELLLLKSGNQGGRSPRAPPETSHKERLHLSQLQPPCAEASSSDPHAISHLYPTPQREPFRSPERGKTETLTRGDLEGTWIRDSLDKSYWIQRVGELSVQLRESTEYWSEKMSDLTAEIEQVRMASPKK